MKKNVIIMGLALVILVTCMVIGCKAEHESKIKSLAFDYTTEDHGVDNYEIELIDYNDEEVTYIYRGDVSGHVTVSKGYLFGENWRS